MMAKTGSDSNPWPAGETKRAMVRDMFRNIAPHYDLLNGMMSLSRHRRWREIAVQMLNLHPGDSALDLCTGTGDFMVPLRAAVGQSGIVLGLDFCEPMVNMGAAKNISGSFGLGDTLQLPIQSGSVNAVTVGWGIRNVIDIDAAHREIYRVLKPGGKFVSIDMAKPKTKIAAAVTKGSLNTALPLLGALFGERKAYTYLPQSIQHFMDRNQLANSMRIAGFENVIWRDLFAGNICIHCGMKSLANSTGSGHRSEGNIN